MGVATGEAAPSVNPPVIYFPAPRTADSVAFPLFHLLLRESGSLTPATPGTVQQNDPKSSPLIPRGSREETPTASFYPVTPFAGAV